MFVAVAGRCPGWIREGAGQHRKPVVQGGVGVVILADQAALAIRSLVLQHCRVESPMDRHLERALSVLDGLLSQRSVFECQIHLSSGRATIWKRATLSATASWITKR